MMQHIGVVGVGNLGKPIAMNMLKAGFQVTVFDIREQPVRELQGLGAKASRSAGEVAGASNIIFSIVQNDTQTETAILGKGGVLEQAEKGSTIIITSTVSPSLCKRVAKRAAEKKVDVLDAPVSGGIPGAEKGTLTIMVGGEKKLLERCRPILEVLGKNIFHFGEIGMGQVAKAVNNAMFHYNLFGAMEGLNLAVHTGIKLERMLELVRISTGVSYPVEHWDVYSTMKKQGPPALDIPYKDLKIAIEIGKEAGIDMPLASFCCTQDIYKLPELDD